MKKFFLLAVIELLCSVAVHYNAVAQQGSIAYFNQEEVWKKLRPHPISQDDIAQQGAIILISNRQPIDTALRFMGIERHNKGMLSYFILTEHNDNWLYKKVASLEEAYSYFPKNKSWVVYNEGMGKIFTTNVYRGLALQQQYGVNVLMMDYPSINESTRPISSYRFAVKNARHMYKDFAPAIDSFRIFSHADNMSINLFMHSMGNYFLRNTVKRRYHSTIYQEPWLANIILNAACVPTKGHSKWLKKVKAAQNIWVHYNPQDKTLYYAHLAMFRKQLGEKTKRPILAKAHYINFNDLVGEAHSNFLTLQGYPPLHREAQGHYHLLFRGLTPNLADTAKYIKSDWKGIGVSLRVQQ